MPGVTVSFEHVPEDRQGPVLGPYPYVQVTYNELWTPDRVEMLAYRAADGLWHTVDGAPWTDYVVAYRP